MNRDALTLDLAEAKAGALNCSKSELALALGPPCTVGQTVCIFFLLTFKQVPHYGFSESEVNGFPIHVIFWDITHAQLKHRYGQCWTSYFYSVTNYKTILLLLLLTITIYCGKLTIVLLSSKFLNDPICQIIWTPPPSLFNGSQNTCSKDGWITWHRRGLALCPGHNVHFTITLIP